MLSVQNRGVRISAVMWTRISASPRRNTRSRSDRVTIPHPSGDVDHRHGTHPGLRERLHDLFERGVLADGDHRAGHHVPGLDVVQAPQGALWPWGAVSCSSAPAIAAR
jgi:hypothetical protein